MYSVTYLTCSAWYKVYQHLYTSGVLSYNYVHAHYQVHPRPPLYPACATTTLHSSASPAVSKDKRNPLLVVSGQTEKVHFSPISEMIHIWSLKRKCCFQCIMTSLVWFLFWNQPFPPHQWNYIHLFRFPHLFRIHLMKTAVWKFLLCQTCLSTSQ